MATPRLYGISGGNRTHADHWGKNQFNSSFPAALACWMRDHQVNPVYLKTEIVDGICGIKPDVTMTWDTVFATTIENQKLTFHFEYPYTPYKEYLHDIERLDNIDLVIKHENEFLRPLEIKLTVLPDNSTSEYESIKWGSELVVRPASTSYAALGIYNSLCVSNSVPRARQIIEPTAILVNDWTAKTAILNNKTKIINALELFFSEFSHLQKPFLMQPIWKTIGKTPELSDNAFDIFIWSDFSLCRTFIDRAKSETEGVTVSRYLRSCARLLRCLHDLTTSGKVHIGRIYREMALGNQTDKEFALNGRTTRAYMDCDRLNEPIVTKQTLSEIILDGGENFLSPERRFDATIYFTAKHLFCSETTSKD
mgnify:CR=1 FL=1